MESIDITDSAFDLGIPNVNTVITTCSTNSDYAMFIYIGAAILIAFIAMFVYKLYSNKYKKSEQVDCDGGFCTMSDSPPLTNDS
jgi:hypothetical protein